MENRYRHPLILDVALPVPKLVFLASIKSENRLTHTLNNIQKMDMDKNYFFLLVYFEYFNGNGLMDKTL